MQKFILKKVSDEDQHLHEHLTSLGFVPGEEVCYRMVDGTRIVWIEDLPEMTMSDYAFNMLVPEDDIDKIRKRILDWMVEDESRMVDDEELIYHPERYPFSEDEYYKLFDSFGSPSGSNFKCDNSDYFEAVKHAVIYKNIKFIFEVCYGQGTLFLLYRPKNKFDEKLGAEML